MKLFHTRGYTAVVGGIFIGREDPSPPKELLQSREGVCLEDFKFSNQSSDTLDICKKLVKSL